MRIFVALACVSGFLCGCQQADAPPQQLTAATTIANTSTNMNADTNPVAKLVKTDEEWRKQLTPEQYAVLRQAGTERAFGPAYDEFKHQGGGTYYCAGCGAELFSSKEKFDSRCGWPSFYDPANAKNVKTRVDTSHGALRTEVLCAVCDGHLGHVFTGEGFKTPTDKRYCINAVSLKFVPSGPEKK